MQETIALTRKVGKGLVDCELSFLDREPIDLRKAARQHAQYENCLSELGLQVASLPADPHFPDGVFVEDVAVVVDEVAVISRIGVESRRGEIKSIGGELMKHRRLEYILDPGTLDGGDVLRIGRQFYVGKSSRTNFEGIIRLQAILSQYDYTVKAVDMQDCLHLKTACTYLGWNNILANPKWVDVSAFDKLDVLTVDPKEPFAANSLAIKQTILYPSSFPKTQSRIQEKGFKVRTLDISELQKAEAGLTCLSIIFDRR